MFNAPEPFMVARAVDIILYNITILLYIVWMSSLCLSMLLCTFNGLIVFSLTGEPGQGGADAEEVCWEREHCCTWKSELTYVASITGLLLVLGASIC